MERQTQLVEEDNIINKSGQEDVKIVQPAK
jgi:hypothetical protein